MSVKRTYGLLSKEERIVRAVFNVEQLQTSHSILLERVKSHHHGREKSAREALRHRQEGNTMFGQKQYSAALEAYNRSIMCSPAGLGDDVTELALAHSNRSAALFYLQKYKECICDIDVALALGCSETIRVKLLARKKQCEVLQDGTNALLASGRSADMLEHRSLPKPVRGYSDTLPGASVTLSMRRDALKGRYIVAERDVAVGDVLCVERPYATILLPDHYETHCHHCLQAVLAPLPCSRCSQVRYCSEVCRQASWRIYHHIECFCLELLHSIGIAHLAMRIILTLGLSDLLVLKHLLYELNDQSKESKDYGPQTASGYLPVFDLVTHLTEMTDEDVFQYGQTAVLLVRCLQTLGWFEGQTCSSSEDGADKRVSAGGEQGDKTDLLMYTASLLLHHICQLICNGHAVTSLTGDSGDCGVQSVTQTRIATAIYPTVSLMNHSCEPSIISSFDGNVLIVKAIKNIKISEEVFNCYGPHWRRMRAEERQVALLEQYFFHCQCDACSGNWLLNDKALLCQSCRGPVEGSRCTACGQRISDQHVIKVSEADQLFAASVQQLSENNIHGALKSLLNCWKLRKVFLFKDNFQLGEVCDCIAKCYVLLGQCEESLPYLERSVQVTRSTYGAQSVELAHELLKQAEVLTEAGRLEAGKDCGKQAEQLLSMHYTPGHDSLRRVHTLLQSLQ